MADIGEHLEAVGLAGLALSSQSAFQLCRHILGDSSYQFSTQAQFGLMAARMQAGDARRLFQQLPGAPAARR